MTESQSVTSIDELPSGEAGEFDAPSDPSADFAEALPEGTQSERGSRRRAQWLPSPAGDAGNAADSGPGGPHRMHKRSAWVLGGAVAVVLVVVAVVLAETLSGGGARMVAVASSSSASPISAAPGAGPLVPIARASAAARKHAPSRAAATAAAPAAAAAQAAASKSAPSPARASGPRPVSWWYLNDDTGMTAQDKMGANPASGSNTLWCNTGGGNCARFNGTDSQFQTIGPVLGTGPSRSFTVEASVFMTATPPDAGSETIVSQDGLHDSGFFLQYSGIRDRWAFSMVTADTDADPAGIRAVSTSAPTLGAWTHLVGVYDAPDHRLRLYVNGVLEGTATDASPFAATGALAIGRALFDGHATDWFNGAANQIEVYNVALTTAEVDKYPS